MVSVGTWNVENLFSPGASANQPISEPEYQAKLAGIAAVIAEAGLDAVALQEVGDDRALSDLVARLGQGWSSVASTAPDERGIRVAVVARLPLTDAVDVVAVPAELAGGRIEDDGTTLTRMGRGALQVRMGTGAGAYQLITGYLKSKLLSYPNGQFRPRNEEQRARYGTYAVNRRAAEAATIRIQANAVLAGQGRVRQLIVLGDLNDTVEAATTQILLGPGGSEIGTPGEDQPDAGDRWRLWNLAPLIPEELRWSRIYRGRRELIDHILVSRAALNRVVEATSLVDPPPPSVDDNPRRGPTAEVSDHALVLCRFRD